MTEDFWHGPASGCQMPLMGTENVGGTQVHGKIKSLV